MSLFFDTLTPTEERVLRLWLAGNQQNDIALKLGCSIANVSQRWKRVRALGGEHPMEILAFAIRKGYLPEADMVVKAMKERSADERFKANLDLGNDIIVKLPNIQKEYFNMLLKAYPRAVTQRFLADRHDTNIHNTRVIISRLRKALGKDAIATANGKYRLDEVWLHKTLSKKAS